MIRSIALMQLLILTIVLNLSEVQAQEKTRLRAATPTGTFETRRGATQLTTVRVEVRNVGEVEASNISVQVKMPNGNLIQLSGPKTLAAKADAVYKGYPYEYVVSDKRLKAEVDCSNCYR